MLSPLSFSGQCTLCRQALSYREGTQISGVWTSLLTEDEGPKQNLSQKLCCFGLSQKLLASLCTFSPVQNTFRWSSRTKMAPADPEVKASWAGQTPVLWQGRWSDVWSPKRALPHKLCGSRLSQKLSASVCTLSPVQTTFQRSPRTKMAPAFLRQKPPGPGGHLYSGQEGSWMSGA